MPLASQLATETFFIPGAVLCHEEVTRRLRAQRDAVEALGIAVPYAVVIRDVYAESFDRSEERWLHGE